MADADATRGSNSGARTESGDGIACIACALQESSVDPLSLSCFVASRGTQELGESVLRWHLFFLELGCDSAAIASM